MDYFQRYIEEGKKEKERKTPVPVIPLFSSGNSSLLYPSILDTRLYTPRSHYRGREGKERREGRKAARGKENLADPLSLFTPPGAGARVESPLATVYYILYTGRMQISMATRDHHERRPPSRALFAY